MFVPNNAIFFASGDLDAAELLERVGAAFGAWPVRELPDAGPPLPAPTPTARRILVVDRPDLTQTQITLAHEGIARTDPDRIAATLLNEAIGGSGFSSRLMQRVRADAGLRGAIAVFQPQEAALAGLTRRIKDGFDPRRILNPGRMYAGV